MSSFDIFIELFYRSKRLEDLLQLFVLDCLPFNKIRRQLIKSCYLLGSCNCVINSPFKVHFLVNSRNFLAHFLCYCSLDISTVLVFKCFSEILIHIVSQW